MNNTTSVSAVLETVEQQSLTAEVIFLVVLQSAITLFVLSNNILVLSAVLMYPDLRRVQNNFTIINMAVTDFLLGAVVLPLSVLFRIYGRWVYGEFVCRFYQGFMSFVCHESVFSALILSFDKYIFIKFPLRYYNWITPKRLLIAITVSWFVAFGDTYLPTLSGWNADPTPEEFNLFPLCFQYAEEFVTFTFIPALGPLLVILYLNFYILKTLRAQNRSIHPQPIRPSGPGQRVLQTTDSAVPMAEPNHGPPKIPQGEIKVIKSMMLIGVMFLILWLPVHVAAVVSSICYCVDPIYIELTHWLGFSNSAINPLLYAYKKDFRVAYGKILKLKFLSEDTGS